MHCNFILYFIALISITAVQAFPLVGGGALGGLGGLLGGGNGLPLVGGLLGGLLARAKKPENPQFINSDQATTQNACNGQSLRVIHSHTYNLLVGTAQCCQSLQLVPWYTPENVTDPFYFAIAKLKTRRLKESLALLACLAWNYHSTILWSAFNACQLQERSDLVHLTRVIVLQFAAQEISCKLCDFYVARIVVWHYFTSDGLINIGCSPISAN